eukprot:GHVP01059558.1.p1 GENE.GHVP01059558.1~~GHVP01059558.1.p1  ORF type:complete len:643 (-),score=102.50 GHVP01059558.1:12-1940(-)
MVFFIFFLSFVAIASTQPSTKNIINKNKENYHCHNRLTNYQEETFYRCHESALNLSSCPECLTLDQIDAHFVIDICNGIYFPFLNVSSFNEYLDQDINKKKKIVRKSIGENWSGFKKTVRENYDTGSFVPSLTKETKSSRLAKQPQYVAESLDTLLISGFHSQAIKALNWFGNSTNIDPISKMPEFTYYQVGFVDIFEAFSKQMAGLMSAHHLIENMFLSNVFLEGCQEICQTGIKNLLLHSFQIAKELANSLKGKGENLQKVCTVIKNKTSEHKDTLFFTQVSLFNGKGANFEGGTDLNHIAGYLLELFEISRKFSSCLFVNLADRNLEQISNSNSNGILEDQYKQKGSAKSTRKADMRFSFAYYHSILSLWIYTGKTDQFLMERHRNFLLELEEYTIIVPIRSVVFEQNPFEYKNIEKKKRLENDILPSNTNVRFFVNREYDSLNFTVYRKSCSVPGLIAQSLEYSSDLDLLGKQKYLLQIADEILLGCLAVNFDTDSGVAPESWQFREGKLKHTKDLTSDATGDEIYSLYSLFDLTKDLKYLNWAWALFENFQEAFSRRNGWNKIKSVKERSHKGFGPSNSEIMGKTLKLFFLIFDVPMKTFLESKFIMNSQAHFFPIANNRGVTCGKLACKKFSELFE